MSVNYINRSNDEEMNLEKEMRDEIDYKIDGIHPKDAIEVALRYGEFIKNKAIDDVKNKIIDYNDKGYALTRASVISILNELKEKK